MMLDLGCAGMGPPSRLHDLASGPNRLWVADIAYIPPTREESFVT